MDRQTASKHKARNLRQTIVLIGGMSLLLALSGELLIGGGIWPWILLGVIFAMSVLPDLPPEWTLRLYAARPLTPATAPRLTGIINELTARAQLEQAPVVYWIPSRTVNAFALGNRDNAAIAVTDGLLKLLTFRELAGVLAHEISHVANNDTRLMSLADLITRMTHMLSLLGFLLVAFALPLVLLGLASISLSAILLLIAAPTLSALMQLALSRTREFDADLEAARITGDPKGLATALAKIERNQNGFWRNVLTPGYRDPEPSLLRTHPDNHERITRLLEVAGKHDRQPSLPAIQTKADPMLPDGYRVLRAPRHGVVFRIWR
jgi:heat shock protein HtpX